MKITNASWDQKNTGLKTCEILFDKGDNFQSYLDANIESSYEFSVVKIPVGNLRLVHQMEDSGYRYLENQMVISFDTDQLREINPRWQRFLEGFSYSLIIDKDQINSIIKQVGDGMFENDRFTLDPFWGREVSSIRYVNWIKDLYEKGNTRFFLMRKNDSEVGFFSLKSVSEKVSSCPIAGIYNQFKSHGYFFALAWFWLEESNRINKKKLFTTISSNNKPLQSFLSKVFSFRIGETLIVMRKVIKV